MTRKLVNALTEFDINTQPAASISGLLGITMLGSQQVAVSTRPGFVYVRLRDSLSEVIQARNGSVSNTYNLPVLVQRTGNTWTVVGKDTERYESWNTTSAYLPMHGATHEFDRMAGTIGADPIFLAAEQLRPLLVSPTSTTGSMTLSIHPYILQMPSGTFSYTGGIPTPDFTPHVPTDSYAIMGLVYQNLDDGTFGEIFNTGTSFSSSLKSFASVSPYIPATPANTSPLCAVRLTSGTSYLGWDNLYDVRQWFGSGAGGTSIVTGTSSGGGSADGFVVDGTLAVLTDVSNPVLITVTTTISKWYIYVKDKGTSSSTIVDIHKNGTTIFTTQANRPEVAWDDVDGWMVATPDVTTFAEGDVLTLDIDQIAVGAGNMVVIPLGTSGGGGTGSVNSVTGLNTDNTDPANPVVQISVDGVTVTGAGTPGSPLVSTGGTSVLDGIFVITAPVLGDFAWVNQGGATVNDNRDVIFIQSDYDTGDNFRLMTKAMTVPTVTAWVMPQLFVIGYASCGILFRESTSGKLVTVNLGNGFPGSIEVVKFTDPTTYAGHYLSTTAMQYPSFGYWLQISDNLSTLDVSISFDGTNFQLIFSVASGDFLVPDEVGFFVNGSDPTWLAGMTLISWLEA